MQKTKTQKRLSEYNDIIKENDNLYRGVAKSLGLPECAFWILYTLRSGEAIVTQSDVCEALYQPKQTVNSALKNLEAEGFIELGSLSDRRSKQIRLTPKGEELAVKTADQVITAEQNALLTLSEAEQQAFIGLFRKYTDALEKQMSRLGENR